MFANVKASCLLKKEGKKICGMLYKVFDNDLICKTSPIRFVTISSVTTCKIYYTVFQKNTDFIFR